MICALTILTSSQAILIYWSKQSTASPKDPTQDEKHAKYKYSVTTSNFLVSKFIIFLCNFEIWISYLHFSSMIRSSYHERHFGLALGIISVTILELLLYMYLCLSLALSLGRDNEMCHVISSSYQNMEN